MRNGLIAATLLVAAVLGPAAAREQIPAEERIYGYDARLPGCADDAVIGRLVSRFGQKEAIYWHSDLTIVSVDRIRTTHFRPNGLDLIPRRYCQARVVLSNQRVSSVYYSVVEDAGMAGNSFGLHFCVTAYDRNWASAPECKMARP